MQPKSRWNMGIWICVGILLAVGPRMVCATAPAWNVVFFLIDDLGWTDLGCFGSKVYQTPAIDRLAAEGMRFTAAYSSCTVCSPTRASIMTGKYPARLHITDWISGHKRPFAKLKVPDWTQQLPLEETTIAEVFKAAGYATASIGKWHLGGDGFGPEKQGFDVNVGGTHKGHPPSYFSPYGLPNLSDGPQGEYLTDRLTDEAERFLDAHRDRPFFLYFPHYAVHTPLQAKADAIAAGVARGLPGKGTNAAVYAAMIASVDESVGRIMARLQALGIAERTLIVFTSDNGGLRGVTSNEPLRAGKGSAYEGGVRVAAIVKWPGVTKPGSVCDEPIVSCDFYPTLLDVAGVADLPGHVPDGVSLTPLLKASGRLNRPALYWHYPHYHPGGATPYGAVRAGEWRLVEFYEDMRVELYNLRNDIGEARDLAAEHPEIAKTLRQQLHAWRTATGAQMPSLNPQYNSAKASKH